MAEPILLLRLEGPLQSWGTRSRWDVRDTGPEPTKSGVVGLLSCALGLRRGDPELERLDRTILFGVRLDRAGLISTDYQTVSGYHRTAAGEFKYGAVSVARTLAKAVEHSENTIVSPRDYLHDAAFLVALAVKAEHQDANPGLLRRLEESLRNPHWPLYLGRKSCVPSRPILDRLTDEYPDLRTALEREPWDEPRSPRVRAALMPDELAPKLDAWIECPDGDVERQDALRLNQLRFYDYRRCRRIVASDVPLRRTS